MKFVNVLLIMQGCCSRSEVSDVYLITQGCCSRCDASDVSITTQGCCSRSDAYLITLGFCSRCEISQSFLEVVVSVYSLMEVSYSVPCSPLLFGLNDLLCLRVCVYLKIKNAITS